MSRWFQRFLLAVVAACAMWAAHKSHSGEVIAELGSLQLLAVGGLFGLSTFLAYVPSWIFLRRAGSVIPFMGFTGVLLASQALNASNPLRMGFPMRVYLLGERYGVSPATASLLIPLEALMTLAIAAMTMSVAAPLLSTQMSSQWTLSLGMIGVATCIVLAAVGRASARSNFPYPTWVPTRLRPACESLRGIMGRVTPSTLVLYAAFFLGSDLLTVVLMKTIAGALGFDAPFFFMLAAASASYLVGLVSLVPQGLGTRDAALGFMLHAGGATPDQATSIVIAIRLATTGLTFLAGLIASLALGLSSHRAAVSTDLQVPR